jgi:4-diphosphocytidyl-2-C-methyl-D-erythritol kinase
MIVFPNAKINLGLRILRKRTDGFHDIETVFYPVPIFDILEIVRLDKDSAINSEYVSFPKGGKVVFKTTGNHIDGNAAENLVVKACRLFFEKSGIHPELYITLHKNIPSGAGLGGGSSDAAFTLKMLNEIEGGIMSLENLKELAAELGSDCAFFIENRPAFATGRGELLSGIDLSLSGFYFVLINPGIHVSTAEAYSGVLRGDKSEHRDQLLSIIGGSVDRWSLNLINDFELSLFEKYPEISEIKNKH